MNMPPRLMLFVCVKSDTGQTDRPGDRDSSSGTITAPPPTVRDQLITLRVSAPSTTDSLTEGHTINPLQCYQYLFYFN